MEKIVKHRDGNHNDSILVQADEAIESAKAKGNEYWDKMKSKSQDLWTGAQSGSRKTWRQTKTFIHKHPVQSIGYAVLFGVIVGALLLPKDEIKAGMQQSELTHPNGKSPLGLLKDHLELASLEWGYEKQEGWRRLLGIGVGAILLFSSYVYLQVALIDWLLKMGLKWGGIGSILGSCYFVFGVLVIWFFGRRQKNMGAPFQGSMTELSRSFKWIEKRFF